MSALGGFRLGDRVRLRGTWPGDPIAHRPARIVGEEHGYWVVLATLPTGATELWVRDEEMTLDTPRPEGPV